MLFTFLTSYLFFSGVIECDKLTNGKYLVHFTRGMHKDYYLRIQDSTFTKYSNTIDSTVGRIEWIYGCMFHMKFNKGTNDEDSVTGPLKLIYDSYGPPCVELGKERNDTILFRTTHPLNLQITENEGYFLKMSR